MLAFVSAMNRYLAPLHSPEWSSSCNISMKVGAKNLVGELDFSQRRSCIWNHRVNQLMNDVQFFLSVTRSKCISLWLSCWKLFSLSKLTPFSLWPRAYQSVQRRICNHVFSARKWLRASSVTTLEIQNAIIRQTASQISVWTCHFLKKVVRSRASQPSVVCSHNFRSLKRWDRNDATSRR